MFLPMSWMSPFTVAMTIGPFGSVAVPLCASAARITSNAEAAASAAIRSCGRKTLPDSKPLPTFSSAGTISPSMTSTGILPAARSPPASIAASCLSPWTMTEERVFEFSDGGVFGFAGTPAAGAAAAVAPTLPCSTASIQAPQLRSRPVSARHA